MRTIKWHSENGMQGSDREGEIEVEDDASDDEIDNEVREAVFDFFSWGWEEVKPNVVQPLIRSKK